MNRALMAMVVAHLDYAGMDRKKFAEFAEHRKVYRQRFWNDPDTPIAFFVMGKGDETLPLPNLADLANAEPLVVVVPSDGLNIKMLSTLRLIDVMRSGIYQKPGVAIQVVHRVGKDAISGEASYVNWEFACLEDLRSHIYSFLSPANRKGFLEYLRGKSSWVDRPGGTVRLSNALVKRALSVVLSKSGGVTLSEIEEHIPDVKPLCPPGDPELRVSPHIAEDIQSQIDILLKKEVAAASDRDARPEPQREPKAEPHQESKPQREATPQEFLIMAMEAVSDKWKPDEVRLQLTPAGYVLMP